MPRLQDLPFAVALAVGAAAGLLGAASCDITLVPSARSGGGGGAGGLGSGASITALTRTTHATFFQIETGAHATTDCNGCHGGLPTFKQFTCVSCHEHSQPVLDPIHAGVTGYTFNSSACLGCHPGGAAGSLSRTDHSARFFPIDVGTSHASGQCSDCHANPGDPSQFTCVSCHEHAQTTVDPAHAGVAGYIYNSTACLGCHPQGNASTLSRGDHGMFFAIDVGTPHAAAQCSDCHTNAADRTQFTCLTSCHAQAPTATMHSGVAVYSYNSTACLTCHPAGRPSLSRTDHRPFMNISSGDHGGLACSSCHKTADYTVFTCLDCHSSNNPDD